MVNEREALRRVASERVGGCPVLWAGSETSAGDFDGRDWTLEVFDVPSSARRSIHEALWELLVAARTKLGKSITLVTHTPENTSRHYQWVRVGNDALLDSAIPLVPRVRRAFLEAPVFRLEERDPERGASLSPRAA